MSIMAAQESPASLLLALAAAAALELFAGASLLLQPQRFIARTYGEVHSTALTLKFARTSGVALLCLGLLGLLALHEGHAPPCVVVTLVAYNAGAAANNITESVRRPKAVLASLVHALLFAALVRHLPLPRWLGGFAPSLLLFGLLALQKRAAAEAKAEALARAAATKAD